MNRYNVTARLSRRDQAYATVTVRANGKSLLEAHDACYYFMLGVLVGSRDVLERFNIEKVEETYENTHPHLSETSKIIERLASFLSEPEHK